MDNKKIIGLVTAMGAVLLVIIALSTSIVSVPEDRSVCVKRFEQIIDVYTEPGIHFKVPILDTITEVPNNALLYDLNPSDVLTLDKKAMTISSYVVWRITDPVMFIQTLGSQLEAERRLDASVYNSAKTLLSSLNQTDAISSRGETLDAQIAVSVEAQMLEYGVELVDIQVKQFDLPPDNKEAVYTRMISERTQIAAQYTAEGKEEAEKIKNQADKEVTFILSQAKALSEQYKGEGESEYMKILAEAYSGAERAEFYEFIRSMDALKVAMTGDKTVVLPIDSPLAKWFYYK